MWEIEEPMQQHSTPNQFEEDHSAEDYDEDRMNRELQALQRTAQTVIKAAESVTAHLENTPQSTFTKHLLDAQSPLTDGLYSRPPTTPPSPKPSVDPLYDSNRLTSMHMKEHVVEASVDDPDYDTQFEKFINKRMQRMQRETAQVGVV